MAARFLRVLRLWVAFLAVFSAAAAPVSAAPVRARPAVTSVLLTERRAVIARASGIVWALPLPWVTQSATEPTVSPPVEPRAARGRLFVKHRALLW
jgi:hypothetical protein